MLAVVSSIAHFHYYLYGRKFTVRSDHSALQWLFNFRNPDGQIARWIQKLQEYDFDVIHRRGTSHQNAAALSRRPCYVKQCTYCPRVENKEKESKTEGSLKMEARQVSARINEENFPEQSCWSTDKMRKEQEADRTFKPIREGVAKSHRPKWEVIAPYGEVTKTLWAQWDSLRERDGVLYRCWESNNGKETTLQLVVPETMRSEVLLQQDTR